MIFKKIPTNVSSLDTNSKNYYLLLPRETHINDNWFLIGSGYPGGYTWNIQDKNLYSINQFIKPNGYLELKEGEILVCKSIVEKYSMALEDHFVIKKVLPVSEKLLNVLGFKKSDLKGIFNCSIV